MDDIMKEESLTQPCNPNLENQAIEPEQICVNKRAHPQGENSLNDANIQTPTKRKGRFSRLASKSADIRADTKKDFGLNLTSSNWGFVAPSTQYEMLRAVSTNQIEQVKPLLEHGAALRDMPVYSLDFSKCMMSQGSAFIRGEVCFQHGSYTRTLPNWYLGSAIYLLENVAHALNDESLIIDFFRGLCAINNGRIGTNAINDCFIIKEKLSLVLLCTPEELTILTRIYNKLRLGFNLISVVKMKI